MMVRTPVSSREDMMALRDVPWEQIRPGVWRRDIQRDGYCLTERRWYCQDCGTDSHSLTDFTVTDEIWRYACPEDGIICIPCLEKRLGRLLTLNDLKIKSPMYQTFLRLLSQTPLDHIPLVETPDDTDSTSRRV